ncbi:hypothetical protein DOG94_18050 [Salmonella enterica subsp. enterica]|nr:hypothetical protein [Salmonella enterica subsp. enterica serovar Hessarek]
MRALPVSELNGPFLCPTHLTKEVCLESNQHLCLARQYSHRCVPVFSPHQARWYADTLTGGLIQRSLKRGARVSWSAITGYHRGALILITSSGQRKSQE